MQPATHAAVDGVHGLAIHERAASHQALEAERFGFTHRFVRHAARAKGPMKPNVSDPPFGALVDKVRCDIRMRGDHEAIDLSRDRRKVGVALNALKFGSVRVHGDRVITGLPELAEDRVGGLPGVSGDSCDCDTLAGQKFCN